MSTIVISISPGNIQVITNSAPADGYSLRKDTVPQPAPELAIVEQNKTEYAGIHPLSELDVSELHDKYKMQ